MHIVVLGVWDAETVHWENISIPNESSRLQNTQNDYNRKKYAHQDRTYSNNNIHNDKIHATYIP